MTLTIEDYIAGFPYPLIPKIQGLPTYESIAEVQRLLNANAASVETTLGGGLLGYLSLTVTAAVYGTHSGGIAFVAPANPGHVPIIAAGTTQFNMAELVRQHTENKRLWLEYQTVGKALRQQAISAIDDIYLRTLRNPITGYATVTVLDLLTHLFTNYGRVTPHDLQLNDQRMRTPYNVDQPIEVLIAQIDEAVEYAAAGQQAYSPEQMVNLAYSLIFATGHYEVACREWRIKATADKTWANYKLHFTAAYNDRRESAVTTQGAGYHGANMVTRDFLETTADALANLAEITVTDRTAVANLVTSNSTLTAQLALRDAEIVDLKNQIKSLKNNRPSGTANANPATGGTAPTRTARPLRITANNNYCWTHGYQIADTHTSATCTKPRDGHQREATGSNPMGGSTFGKQA
jgi:hypothetical protein